MPSLYRPAKDSSAVIAEAVRRTLLPLGRWLRDNEQDFDDEKVMQDIGDALLQHGDGYAMAKFLEASCGWDGVDAELVTILEGARARTGIAHTETWCGDGLKGPRQSLG